MSKQQGMTCLFYFIFHPSLFNIFSLLVFLGLDFFATIVLVVYVAIIAVLFLFVIIMSNIKIVKIYKNVLDFFNL